MFNRAIFIKLFVILIVIGISSLVFYSAVEYTSTPEYCASCHEMQPFYDSWSETSHGMKDKGVVKAVCVDCHLPHTGTLAYMLAKGKSGANDTWAHITGRKTDWIANLEDSEEYTYHTGCRKCHVELVAQGIPLKAYRAHNQYKLGETSMTCVTCHDEAGHGDVADFMSADNIRE